jgi:hypothetical protein
MTEVMSTKKPRKQKAAYPFPVELIDQLLAQVENKDAESILRESGLAGQLKKMLAERMLTAELSQETIGASVAGAALPSAAGAFLSASVMVDFFSTVAFMEFLLCICQIDKIILSSPHENVH